MTIFVRSLFIATLMLVPFALVQGAESRWVDSISLALGKDNNTNKTEALQFGLQNNWNRTLFNEGAWFMSGYWDASVAYLKSDLHQHHSLYDISLTPFLRVQRDAELSSGVTPFSEFGVGGHLLTDTKIGDRDLATRIQFGPQVGLGLGFGSKGNYQLAYHFEYLTNGGIKGPNDGLKMHFVSFSYAFR